MSEFISVGLLLKKKDRDHLGIPVDDISLKFGNCQFTVLDEEIPIKHQGSFDVVIHKISDYIKPRRSGDHNAQRIIEEFNDPKTFTKFCIENPSTVISLADRETMFKTMELCKLTHAGITVHVPRWVALLSKKDVKELKNSDFTYPLICKALCAGEGPGGHSMQLVFNPEQLDDISVYPCISQEFKNHDGTMVKIFVFGRDYFICTRPSVRNFPINGQPIQNLKSIRFDSHQVAKLSSKTFLNNYQNGFALKNSQDGDQILNDSVVRELLCKISEHIDSNILGIDILVSDNGQTYNLVDINYLPSFEGVDNRFQRLINLINDHVSNGGPVNYWQRN